jgi:hypothetical protein
MVADPTLLNKKFAHKPVKNNVRATLDKIMVKKALINLTI